jgi:hypothetical protein
MTAYRVIKSWQSWLRGYSLPPQNFLNVLLPLVLCSFVNIQITDRQYVDIQITDRQYVDIQITDRQYVDIQITNIKMHCFVK